MIKNTFIIFFIFCLAPITVLSKAVKKFQPRANSQATVDDAYSLVNLTAYEVYFDVEWGDVGDWNFLCSNDRFFVPAHKKIVFSNSSMPNVTYFDYGSCYIKSLWATVVLDPRDATKNIVTSPINNSWRTTSGLWLVRESNGPVKFILEKI